MLFDFIRAAAGGWLFFPFITAVMLFGYLVDDYTRWLRER